MTVTTTDRQLHLEGAASRAALSSRQAADGTFSDPT